MASSDPLAYVRPGQDLGSFLSDHRRLNLWTDAAKAVRDSGQGGGRPFGGAGPRQLICWVVNGTGVDLPQFSVLGVPTVLNAAPPGEPARVHLAIRDTPLLTGGAPTAGRAFVITQEPIKAAAAGPPAVVAGTGVATVLGLTPVQLLDDAPAAYFAEAITGDPTRLRSAAAGAARIVARYAAGWALVLLGDGGGYLKDVTATCVAGSIVLTKTF